MSEYLPHNLETEKAALGAMLEDRSATEIGVKMLNASDFFHQDHALLFDIMSAIHNRRGSVDVPTVAEAMLHLKRPGASFDDRSLHELLRGDAYLFTLMQIGLAANIEQYCVTLRSYARRREVMVRAKRAYDLASQGEMDVLTAANGYYNLSSIARADNAEANPFARGLLAAADFSEHETSPGALWFGFYPGSITYLCGQTGAGKSSLLYNVMIHMARNEPLWGVPFGLKRPGRILYLDPENSGNFQVGRAGLCREKVERIGQGKPKGLVFHDGQGVNLAIDAHMESLGNLIENGKFDAVVLDPIINLFGTKDENDNAEAGRQFNALRHLCKITNVCAIPVHHTGRDEGSLFGRGATARLSSSDIGLMLRIRGDADDVDDDLGKGQELQPRNNVVRLQMVKNKPEPGKASVYLRMIGNDRFERVTFAEWRAARQQGSGGNTVSAAMQAENEIRVLLADKKWHSRSEVVEILSREMIGKEAADTALGVLTDSRELICKRQGKGGSKIFMLSEAYDPGNAASNFPSLSSDVDEQETRKLNEQANESVNGFMASSDPFAEGEK